MIKVGLWQISNSGPVKISESQVDIEKQQQSGLERVE